MLKAFDPRANTGWAIAGHTDGGERGSFCELKCDEGYYIVSKSDGFCKADAGGATASYTGANVNCRICSKIEHCLGHESERRLATGFVPPFLNFGSSKRT